MSTVLGWFFLLCIAGLLIHGVCSLCAEATDRLERSAWMQRWYAWQDNKFSQLRQKAIRKHYDYCMRGSSFKGKRQIPGGSSQD